MPTRILRRTSDASPSVTVPRLLVSVRSADEATSAIRGGTDILDVKEPSHGPLGMANIHAIRDIANRVTMAGRELGFTPPLSVALGELRDWTASTEIPVLPPEVSFAKLGLSGLNALAQWPLDWRRVREKFDQQRVSPLRWVGVAYADAPAAHSPPLEDVLAAAIEAECAGLLIDTFAKRGPSLLDLCSADVLINVGERCNAAGLFFAVAGRLSQHDLPRLCHTKIDVVAIRSAACVASDRESRIDDSLVVAFRQAIIREFTPLS